MSGVPYGPAEFFDVFRAYHASFPLAPIIWTLVALVSVVLIVRGVSGSNRVASAVLAGLWIWAGVAYHLLHFAEINPLARLFGVLFAMEGVLLAGAGLVNRRIEFSFRRTVAGITGGVLIVYAVLLYPLIGRLAGHGFPAGPTMGVPCPTTIFTFGLFLWSIDSLPRYLLPIPILWAFLAAPAAMSWGVIEDIMMPLAALFVLVVLSATRHFRTARDPAAG